VVVLKPSVNLLLRLPHDKTRKDDTYDG
jgi:hypothetical protein